MSPLAQTILQELKTKPRQFSEVVDAHRDVAWRDFLRAWGEIREKTILQRDDDGQYLVPKSSSQDAEA